MPTYRLTYELDIEVDVALPPGRVPKQLRDWPDEVFHAVVDAGYAYIRTAEECEPVEITVLED